MAVLFRMDLSLRIEAALQIGTKSIANAAMLRMMQRLPRSKQDGAGYGSEEDAGLQRAGI